MPLLSRSVICSDITYPIFHYICIIHTFHMRDPEYISKTKLEIFASLDTPKMRRRRGLFPVEGVKSISDISDVFKLETLLVDASAWDLSDEENALYQLVRNVSIEKTRLIRAADMKRLSSFSTPPSAVAIFAMPEEPENDGTENPEPGKLYLLLDGVRDPGNFGTIIRTADWFGVHTVFASHDCADVFNQKVIQATMGSLAHVKIVYTDLSRLVAANSGIPLFGTLLEGENIYHAELPAGGFIAMGNEGKGLSEDMRRLVSRPLTIPPFDSIHGESLNVGAATAVVLSEFRRR